MPYGRGIETACLLLFMMKSYNPMKAKVAGVFFFSSFDYQMHQSRAAASSMLILENVMVCLWHKTRNGACGEKRPASYMYLPVPVRTASSHNRDIHYSEPCVWCFSDGLVNLVFQLRRDRPSVTSAYWTSLKRNSCF